MGSIRGLLTRMPLRAPVRVEVGAAWVRTARMVLRPLGPGDYAEFLRVLRTSGEDLARTFPLRNEGESEAGAFERHVRLSAFAGPRAPDWRRAAFTPDGRLVGGFNLNAIRRGLEFRAEASWWVAREFRGRGLATEGVRAMLEVAFREIGAGGLGLHRVDALVNPQNAASRRVAEKAGFVRPREPVRGRPQGRTPMGAAGFVRPREPVRVSLEVGGRWVEHELLTRYVEASAQVEGKPLPAVVLRRVDELVRVLERADPGVLAPAAMA